MTEARVTQDDREAAALWYRRNGQYLTAHITDGFEDDGSLVQAFAHHREQARTDALREAAAICGDLAETTYDDADGFAAATGCEAAILALIQKDQAA